ncbi:nucleoside hydrolase [Gemella cuniculi]|uniref:nucleoside hydrolase n=1 Tax=Gemella cuniculi TaxID=150240 RepID=UPI000410370B|nr:nucleoside hydrolase [Gemella cuniculi]
MKIIYDCDNTMGLEYRDIDDGLALLYLYKNPSVKLLGVTLTFGNDSLEKVIESTERLKKNLSLKINLIYGNETEDSYLTNKAAQFIVEETKKFPGEITILATGSLKNIADAYLLDNSIFSRIKTIVMMGGITEALVINNKEMKELNFTISYKNSYEVLKNSKNSIVLTGNACLNSKLYINEITSIINSFSNNNKYLYEKCISWIKFHSDEYDANYIIVWDLLAAVYVTNPEYFENKKYKVEVKREYLKTGFIKKSCNGNQVIHIPNLKNKEDYIKIVKKTYSI